MCPELGSQCRDAEIKSKVGGRVRGDIMGKWEVKDQERMGRRLKSWGGLRKKVGCLVGNENLRRDTVQC